MCAASRLDVDVDVVVDADVAVAVAVVLARLMLRFGSARLGSASLEIVV